MSSWNSDWASAPSLIVDTATAYHGLVALFCTIIIAAMSYITIYLLVFALRQNQRVSRLRIRALFFTITLESADSSTEPERDVAEADGEHRTPISRL